MNGCVERQETGGRFFEVRNHSRALGDAARGTEEGKATGKMGANGSRQRAKLGLVLHEPRAQRYPIVDNERVSSLGAHRLA